MRTHQGANATLRLEETKLPVWSMHCTEEGDDVLSYLVFPVATVNWCKHVPMFISLLIFINLLHAMPLGCVCGGGQLWMMPGGNTEAIELFFFVCL